MGPKSARKKTLPEKEDRIDRLEQMLEGLLGVIALKKPENPPQQGGRRADDMKHGSAWQGDDRSLGNLKLTPYGRPVCGKCGTEGHIMRECGRTSNVQIVCMDAVE